MSYEIYTVEQQYENPNKWCKKAILIIYLQARRIAQTNVHSVCFLVFFFISRFSTLGEREVYWLRVDIDARVPRAPG